MTEPKLKELLEDAAERVPPGFAPVDRILARCARGRRRRTLAFTSGALAAIGALALGAVQGGWVSWPDSATTAQDAATQPARSGSSSAPTGQPPMPAPITMSWVQTQYSAQEFRPYSGPSTPPITEAEAALRVHDPHAYSLGLTDIGMVNENHSIPVEWHSVWVFGDVTYMTNIYESYRGPGSPPPPRAGWVRLVTMIDAQTGETVIQSID